jgi:hypothetical protein
MPDKALVVCNHPGAARAVLPVVEKMIETMPGLCFKLLLTRHSLSLAELPSDRARTELREEMVSADEYGAMDLHEYRFVLTGTSIKGNLEASVIRKARSQRVPVFTVLDHWCDYGARFGEADGQLTAIPDVIFVPDAIAQTDLLHLGVPGAHIVVSGHPAFDRLAGIRVRFSEGRRRQILDTLDLSGTSRVVLFVSEPMAADHAANALGYSELTVLREICTALAQLPAASRPPLLIKPHPREAPDSFDGVLRAFPDLTTRIVNAHIDRHELILASSLVLGIDSVMLLEATVLGTATFSVQIGESNPHCVIAASGRISVIRDFETLVALLRGERAPSIPACPDASHDAAQAIVDGIRTYAAR